MKRSFGCMLFSLFLSLPLFAERSAPKITQEPSKISQPDVPIALQHPHIEAPITNENSPSRVPSEAPKEVNIQSVISHTLEVPNLEEYKEAFQNGDKTSAIIPEKKAEEAVEE